MRRGGAGSRRGRALLGVGALLVAGAGCGDGSSIAGLGESFDPLAALEVVEALSGAGEENVAAAHVALAANVLARAAAPGASAEPRRGVPVARAVRGSAGEGRAEAPTFAAVVRAPVLSLADARLRAVRAASGARAAAGARAALVPDTLLGVTFGLQTIGGYAPLADREGAPPDGVRFLTYQLDPLTGRPRTVPLKQAGHLDIWEPSSAGPSRLEIRGARGGGSGATTVLDFFLEGTVSFSETELSSEFVSAGELLDGKRRVEFSVDERVALPAGFERLEISLARRIEAPETGRSVTLSWEGVATAEATSVTVLLGVADGGHTMTLDVASSDVAASGSVLYDGRTVAFISGDPFEPAFTRPDGSAFAEADREALMGLFVAVDAVLLFGDRMLPPLAILFETG